MFLLSNLGMEKGSFWLGKLMYKLGKLGKAETCKKYSSDVQTPTELNFVAFFLSGKPHEYYWGNLNSFLFDEICRISNRSISLKILWCGFRHSYPYCNTLKDTSSWHQEILIILMFLSKGIFLSVKKFYWATGKIRYFLALGMGPYFRPKSSPKGTLTDNPGLQWNLITVKLLSFRTPMKLL